MKNMHFAFAFALVASAAVAACGGSPGEALDSENGAQAKGGIGTPIRADAGCTGIGLVICINDTHFDPTLCECVPNADAAVPIVDLPRLDRAAGGSAR